MDEIVDLLSNETIDSLIKLYEIYTDFPPKFKDLWLKKMTK